MTEPRFQVRLPANVDSLTPDDEYFYVVWNDEEQKIRLHDYAKIYKIPGLYEYIISDILKCVSHEVVSELLIQQILRCKERLSDLTVLDFGAGTGMVGETLTRKGVKSIVGIDIVEEAAIAAQRDHPGVYEKYYVEDACNLGRNVRQELENKRFNCLVCVSSLAPGHILPDAFIHAYNLITNGGWIAFNILGALFEERGPPGPFNIFDRIIESKTLEVKVRQSYCHRLRMDGTPFTNVAIIGKKAADI